VACSNKAKSAETSVTSEPATTVAKSSEPTDTTRVNKLQMPDIPTMLTTPEDRLAFLTKNYWNHFHFGDTTLLHDPEYSEQAWVDYINLLGMLPPKEAAPVLRDFLIEAEAHPAAYRYFTGMADKYLYDPNSPLRNEELYIPVLDQMLGSKLLSRSEKVRPQDRRTMAEKNRLGKKAADFSYILRSGEAGSLYRINADYTLLFFNNPGCHACRETIESLKQAPYITRSAADGKLKIVAIYPDKDRSEWVKYLYEFPQEWINGYDGKLVIESKRLYDLKAIPSLYLLDKNKTVLLKDATVEAIEQYLQRSLR
jgi:thiol-disulfide isomerase/thioredoxin